jgi:hypothetical protein
VTTFDAESIHIRTSLLGIKNLKTFTMRQCRKVTAIVLFLKNDSPLSFSFLLTLSLSLFLFGSLCGSLLHPGLTHLACGSEIVIRSQTHLPGVRNWIHKANLKSLKSSSDEEWCDGVTKRI